MHPNRADFNWLTIEGLFDLLLGSEYEMIRIHGFALASSTGKKPEKENDDMAFKAEI